MQYPGGRARRFARDIEQGRPAPFSTAAQAGFFASQVHLAIGSYILFCAPLRISGNHGVFLAVLRRQEADLFEGLRDSPCSATLPFKEGDGSFSIRLHGSLEGISELSGWPDACRVDVSLPRCPEDLLEVLGLSIDPGRGLGKVFESLAGTVVDLTAANAALMNYPGSADLSVSAATSEATVCSLAVDSLGLKVSPPFPSIPLGAPCTVKLHVPGGPFDVSGTITQVRRREDCHLEVVVAVDFAPQLIEMVDGYVARRNRMGLEAAG
jgi:hypothetical protein